ncbi:MAG TPA: TolC family protein [Terriglobales bacterium]|nr:TolC family protein [Terriglobales bacterium]
MHDKISVAVLLTTMLCAGAFARLSANAETTEGLPTAPLPQAVNAQSAPVSTAPAQAPSQAQGTPGNPRTSRQPGAATPLSLTLKQAEALAIKNNPQISMARLLALASQQVTREVRSDYWPTATGDITGVDAQSGSRITAGALNNPIIFDRAAAGVMVSQLITDFGRTRNLVSSANYRAKAEDENAVATKEQILLAVDRAFYGALQAQAVLTVAQQTVNARQTVANQVQALFQSKLKSELDLSFANVNLAQAQLLLLDAQNNRDAAEATLSMVLGAPTLQKFQLVEEPGAPMAPPANVEDLITQALAMRPEILSLQYQYDSARKFQTAERDLLFPSIRALGGVGDTAVGDAAVAPSPGALNNTYGAVGANMQIPLFNGFLYTARAREAKLRAQATDERLRDTRNLIARAVRTSWLNASTAYHRLTVTQELVQQANLSLNLAQSRYDLGLGSIVELSQAQLQQTQAQIGFAQATYDYRLSLAVLAYETTGI